MKCFPGLREFILLYNSHLNFLLLSGLAKLKNFEVFPNFFWDVATFSSSSPSCFPENPEGWLEKLKNPS